MVLIGQSVEFFYRLLRGRVPVYVKLYDISGRCRFSLSADGEVVLLSPACSSLDMFLDFEARGLALRTLFRVGSKN